MKYLLDTHAFLWVVDDHRKLTRKVKEIYLNPANEIYLSAASIWEMAIKISLKKLSLTLELNRFVSQHVKGNDIRILTVKAQHTYPLVGLPFHHRDPFDRLLVSQCLSEKLSLISKDATFDKYPIKRIW